MPRAAPWCRSRGTTRCVACLAGTCGARASSLRWPTCRSARSRSGRACARWTRSTLVWIRVPTCSGAWCSRACASLHSAILPYEQLHPAPVSAYPRYRPMPDDRWPSSKVVTATALGCAARDGGVLFRRYSWVRSPPWSLGRAQFFLFIAVSDLRKRLGPPLTSAAPHQCVPQGRH